MALVIVFGIIQPAHPVAADTRPVPSGCQYVLGFQAMHDRYADVIGDCTDNQAFSGNGDAVQHTTKGILVWRKASNTVAFTNGAQTWANGPFGFQGPRGNDQVWGWEIDGPVGGTDLYHIETETNSGGIKFVAPTDLLLQGTVDGTAMSVPGSPYLVVLYMTGWEPKPTSMSYVWRVANDVSGAINLDSIRVSLSSTVPGTVQGLPAKISEGTFEGKNFAKVAAWLDAGGNGASVALVANNNDPAFKPTFDALFNAATGWMVSIAPGS